MQNVYNNNNNKSYTTIIFKAISLKYQGRS